jgi:hypothetical protein
MMITDKQQDAINSQRELLIELFADPCSNEARIGVGITLRTAEGVRVVECRGGDAAAWVTWKAVNHPARLKDGRTGILREDISRWSDRYWLDMTTSSLGMLLALMAHGFSYSDAEWKVARVRRLNAEKIAQLRDEYDSLS